MLTYGVNQSIYLMHRNFEVQLLHLNICSLVFLKNFKAVVVANTHIALNMFQELF